MKSDLKLQLIVRIRPVLCLLELVRVGLPPAHHHGDPQGVPGVLAPADGLRQLIELRVPRNLDQSYVIYDRGLPITSNPAIVIMNHKVFFIDPKCLDSGKIKLLVIELLAEVEHPQSHPEHVFLSLAMGRRDQEPGGDDDCGADPSVDILKYCYHKPEPFLNCTSKCRLPPGRVPWYSLRS